MKAGKILSILGAFLFFIGVLMILPLSWSLFCGDPDVEAFGITIVAVCAFGGVLYFASRSTEEITLTHREGFLIVAAGWFLAAAAGSLPYMFTGVLPGFTDAFFESASGFTTTGASVISGLDALPHGILLWRSMTQWLGGMGIIILSIAILPLLGVGGMQLYKAEMPSPVKDKLTPRITETARTLWIVYVILSTAEFILLLFGGLDPFDALCHTFTTMATGGFSTHDASIAYFQSPYVQTVITLFMIIAGINFTLHHSLLLGDFRTVFRNSELRFYLGVLLVATLLVTYDLWHTVFDRLLESFRYAAFQVVSIMTTTGFVTDNYERWPGLSRFLLLLLFFVGGSAGSTGGSIKCLRILLILKHSAVELYRLVHPHAVTAVKLGKQIVAPETMASVWGFFILYLGLTVTATVLLLLLGLDPLTSFSATASTIANVGPAFGLANPSTTYAGFPCPAKWILSFCMIAGRLEIYTIMVLLTPEFWKK
jgi:trk system potassium uptake protein TrkH